MRTAFRPIAALCVLAVALAGSLPARAQGTPAMPPGMPAMPGMPGGMPNAPSGNTSLCSGAGPSIGGDVAFAGKPLQPSAVSIMPFDAASAAYIENMQMAFGTPADRQKSIAVAHDPAAMNRMMYVAMHEGDIMGSMRYARPTGTHFSCSGLAPGKYYVLAMVNQAYRPRGQYSNFVRTSNRIVFYLAQAVVQAAPVKRHGGDPVARPSAFKYLGATASDV